MPYRLSPEAVQNLEDIFYEGLITFGEHQARKYQDSLKRLFDVLASMPTIGRRSERNIPGEHRFRTANMSSTTTSKTPKSSSIRSFTAP